MGEEAEFPRRSSGTAVCGGNRKSRGSSIPPEKQWNGDLRGKRKALRKPDSPGGAGEWLSAGEWRCFCSSPREAGKAKWTRNKLIPQIEQTKKHVPKFPGIDEAYLPINLFQ